MFARAGSAAASHCGSANSSARRLASSARGNRHGPLAEARGHTRVQGQQPRQIPKSPLHSQPLHRHRQKIGTQGKSADNERCRAETAQHRPPAAGPVPPGAAARTRRSHDPTDPHRRGPRRTIGLYSIRRATNASMSDVGQSSHCASSTTSSTGAVSRRLRDKVKGAASSPAVPNMTGDPPTPPSRISRAAGRRDKAGDKIRRAAS
jgi:hypothetical protein